MRIAAALTGTALLLAIVPAPATPAKQAAAAQDWSRTVRRLPSGAFVLGSPIAKVRLIEYASLTCSHCAAFAGEGLPALRNDYIRRGLVSLELRHAVRDPADLAASLLARCAGPRGYFGAVERLMAKQAEWLPLAAASLDANAGAPAPDPAAVLATTSTAAGLPAIAGTPPAAANACIASKAEQAVLGKMTEEAWGVRKIGGTPYFLINDKPATGSSWATLQPQLAAALR